MQYFIFFNQENINAKCYTVTEREYNLSKANLRVNKFRIMKFYSNHIICCPNSIDTVLTL